MLPREPTPCLPNRVAKREDEQELGLEGRRLPSWEGPGTCRPTPWGATHPATSGKPQDSPGSVPGGFLLTPLGGGTSIIPILCMRRQAHMEYVTCSITGQNQVPAHPVGAQSSMLVRLKGP